MQRAAVNWTSEQSQVIESRGKNLLVSAAARKRKNSSSGRAHHPYGDGGRKSARNR